jgi:hypothetical protein
VNNQNFNIFSIHSFCPTLFVGCLLTIVTAGSTLELDLNATTAMFNQTEVPKTHLGPVPIDISVVDDDTTTSTMSLRRKFNPSELAMLLIGFTIMLVILKIMYSANVSTIKKIVIIGLVGAGFLWMSTNDLFNKPLLTGSFFTRANESVTSTG